jgi:methionine-gamma-lyase
MRIRRCSYILEADSSACIWASASHAESRTESFVPETTRGDTTDMHPESLMMGYGYRPEWSEGSLKSPIFQTSTFVFESAEDGKRFFEVAYGLRPEDPGEAVGLIYSRINNPDLEILEQRLTLWDGAEAALAFSSGMAAIATTLLAYLRPGDVLLHSSPLYGGTSHVVGEILPQFGIESVRFCASDSEAEIDDRLCNAKGALAMVLLETPANPTNDLIDIEMAARVAVRHSTEDRRALVAVDNTFLGPLFQHPLDFGADIVLYSVTKFIGGHSDLIAGACLGSEDALAPIAAMRTFLGTMASPWTGWLAMRSLETLSLRMNRQAETAQRIAEFLRHHPKVQQMRYLGLLEPGSREHDLFKQQCRGAGAMLSFDVEGGEAGAFRLLNALQLVKLAVSLGGTESLAEHPASMTHAGVDPEEKHRRGITPGLVRLSIGVEHYDDLVRDLSQALEAV